MLSSSKSASEQGRRLEGARCTLPESTLTHVCARITCTHARLLVLTLDHKPSGRKSAKMRIDRDPREVGAAGIALLALVILVINLCNVLDVIHWPVP